MNMKELHETYLSIQMALFPMEKEGKIDFYGKIKEFYGFDTKKTSKFLKWTLA